jgi:hypothetical protein
VGEALREAKKVAKVDSKAHQWGFQQKVIKRPPKTLICSEGK